jgi:hypothetical protein
MMRTTEGARPITENEIGEFERRQQVRLPDQYKMFLLASNGGRPERDMVKLVGIKENPVARIHFFFGIGDPEESCDLDWNREVFSDRIPREFLPIATTEGADKFCLCISGQYQNQIFFWDGYGGKGPKLLPVAPTFEEFAAGLFRDQNSPEIRLFALK